MIDHPTPDLANYIFEIAERSNAGQIPWSQPNPSTFLWNQDDFAVTIQKALLPLKLRGLMSPPIGSSPEDSSYLFQVQERGSRQNVMSISSNERPEYFPVLYNLYRAAEKGMDVRAAQVLQRLLTRDR